MPGIPSPHFFGMKAIGQLAENRLNSIAYMRQPTRPGLGMFGFLVGASKAMPLACRWAVRAGLQ